MDDGMGAGSAGFEVVNSRVFPLPRGKVFEAFRGPGHHCRRQGPAGFTKPMCSSSLTCARAGCAAG